MLASTLNTILRVFHLIRVYTMYMCMCHCSTCTVYIAVGDGIACSVAHGAGWSESDETL